MIPSPANFSSWGEHLRDNHYEPKTLAECLLSYLQVPNNRSADAAESVGHDYIDDIDEMHQKWHYLEIIRDFVRVLIPFVENPEVWQV